MKAHILIYGFSIFAMFFGSGNLVFPLKIGIETESFWFFSFIGLLFTGIILPFLGLFVDSHYQAQTEKWLLTLRMARIMFFYIYLVCTYALFTAILNALGHFAWPALAPAFFNLIMILSTLLPMPLLPWNGFAIAWGVVLGGVVQFAVLYPGLKKLGYWPQSFSFHWSTSIQSIFRRMLPSMAGMGLLQLMTLVNLYLASHLPEGVISYINLVDRLVELPLSLIAVSLGVALLPTLSRQWGAGETQKMVETSSDTVILNLYLALPAALGLGFLAEPIIQLLFQRGTFLLSETILTAQILRINAGVVFFSSLVRVFSPNFYAMKNTWYPALVAGLCLVFHIGTAPVLIKLWGVLGLNLATVISSALNLLFLIVGFSILVPQVSYPWGKVVQRVVRFGLPLFGLGGVLLLSTHFYWVDNQWGLIGRLLYLLGVVLLSVSVYFLLSFWVRVPEFTKVYFKLQKRWSFLPQL